MNEVNKKPIAAACGERRYQMPSGQRPREAEAPKGKAVQDRLCCAVYSPC
jgi:hypothetical protein